jgi:oryzin
VFHRRAGQDTFAYVVDTSIDIEHPDFQGRASVGYMYESRFLLALHGTAVASLTGGFPLGVAQLTNLIDIKFDHIDSIGNSRMLACAALDAVFWAVQDIKAKKREDVAVVNLSLGMPGGSYLSLETLIEVAFEAGVSFVVSAGNMYA